MTNVGHKNTYIYFCFKLCSCKIIGFLQMLHFQLKVSRMRAPRHSYHGITSNSLGRRVKSRTDAFVPCETRCYPFPIFVAIPPLSPLSLSETQHQSLPGARTHPLSGPCLQGVLVAVKKEKRITLTQFVVWNWLLLPRTGQKFSRSQETTIW